MARANIFRACIYFTMLFLGIIAQDMETVLDIHCDLKSLVAGSSHTLQELCGENFQVFVRGITADTAKFPYESFPWKLDVTMVTDATNPNDIIHSKKTVQIDQSMLHHGDNITEIITNSLAASLGGPEFQIPAGKCDNRDGKGIMRLYSEQSGFDKEYFGKGFFRVLCDFSGVDLVLEVHTSAGQPYPGNITALSPINLQADSLNTSSDLYYVTELSNIKIVVEGNLPVLDPADTCIFGIAFLTKANIGHMLPSPQKCMQMGYDVHVPEITYYDTLLGIPICLSSGNTGVDLLEIVKESTENISLCGEYTLVLQVDPMHTLHNEMNKCNNYLTFDINFNCYMSHGGMTHAHCDIMMDPFGSSVQELFDTRFIYHRTDYNYMNYETNHDIRMFREDKQSWMEIYDDHTGMHTQGFGLLKVYNKYLESNDIGSTCTDLATDNDIQSAISDLEGLADVLLAANKDFDMDTLVPAYTTAKGKMDQMSISKDYGGIVSEVEAIIRSMVDPDKSRPFNEHVNFMAGKSAVNATMKLADALRSGMTENDIKMHVQMHACETAAWLENMPMVLMWLNERYSPDNQKYGMENLLHVVGNLTNTVLQVHYLYPEFTCIEDVLVNVLHYVEQWSNVSPEERHSVDLDWMFDVDQVKDANEFGNEKLAFSDCRPRVNQCVKKLQTMCFTDPMSLKEPAMASHENVCRARYFKRQAGKQFRMLGLLKHKRSMVSDDMNDKTLCRNDPIAPHKGPLTLWKMVHERIGNGHSQVIYKGMPTLDNKNIMWQKVSVCTCEQCHGNVKKRRRR